MRGNYREVGKQGMMGRLLTWIRHRARFRGSFLFLSGMVAVPYGIGLMLASQTRRQLRWWPGSLRSLAGLPLDFWAWIWMGVGVMLISTFWAAHDRVQFGMVISLNATWTLFALNRGIRPPYDPGAWAPGFIYLGITAALILIASWPDPPELVCPDNDGRQ